MKRHTSRRPPGLVPESPRMPAVHTSTHLHTPHTRCASNRGAVVGHVGGHESASLRDVGGGRFRLKTWFFRAGARRRARRGASLVRGRRHRSGRVDRGRIGRGNRWGRPGGPKKGAQAPLELRCFRVLCRSLTGLYAVQYLIDGRLRLSVDFEVRICWLMLNGAGLWSP